jgi:hypothetical protein
MPMLGIARQRLDREADADPADVGVLAADHALDGLDGDVRARRKN